MFLNHTKNGDVTPDIFFIICDPEGKPSSRMTGVQSAKINFDMENPTTLELEAVSDKSFYYLSQCDGSELIRVDYKDFTWYFAPRTFELKVNKLTTPIAKFSAVDAMGAFRSQIAYNGVDATHVRQNFKTTFQQKGASPNSYLGNNGFVGFTPFGTSNKAASFETRAMQWGELMDIYTEQAGLRFVIETYRNSSGQLQNTLVYFEPGKYVAEIDESLRGYVPRWRFDRGDFSDYEVKTTAAEAQVLMMYDDAEDVNDSRTVNKVDKDKSMFAIREAIMHTPKEMFANIARDPASSPEVGFFAKNAYARADVKVALAEHVVNRMTNSPRGDERKIKAFRSGQCWRPGMLVDIVIGDVTQRQEIVRAELVLENGRFQVTPVLATPGAGSRDFYSKLGDLNSTVQRMSQRRS